MINQIRQEIEKNEYKSEDAATVANLFFYNATGTINDKGFHIEFSFVEYQEAQEFAELLATYDMFPKLINKGKMIVYLKSGECVCNLLALIGAKKSLMELHNKIVERSVRNDDNRRTNCDIANLRRQTDVAALQIEQLGKLAGEDRFKLLSDKLQLTAKLRIENPDASYEELGKMLNITKSGLVNRLAKLLSQV